MPCLECGLSRSKRTPGEIKGSKSKQIDVPNEVKIVPHWFGTGPQGGREQGRGGCMADREREAKEGEIKFAVSLVFNRLKALGMIGSFIRNV